VADAMDPRYKQMPVVLARSRAEGQGLGRPGLVEGVLQASGRDARPFRRAAGPLGPAAEFPAASSRQSSNSSRAYCQALATVSS